MTNSFFFYRYIKKNNNGILLRSYHNRRCKETQSVACMLSMHGSIIFRNKACLCMQVWPHICVQLPCIRFLRDTSHALLARNQIFYQIQRLFAVLYFFFIAYLFSIFSPTRSIVRYLCIRNKRLWKFIFRNRCNCSTRLFKITLGLLLTSILRRGYRWGQR